MGLLRMVNVAFPIILFTFVYTFQTASIPGCLWHNNTCVDACPEWMVEHKSDCNRTYWQALRTCDNPEVVYVGTVCGFSRCDCPDSTVLDTDTGYCYEVDNCPTKHNKLK